LFHIWMEFIICVFFILIAGTKLCKFGDIIAEKTGLGRMWIGVFLIAAATSLPELITTTSCASLVQVPDMALGVIFGSCVFNLIMIVLLDFLDGPGPIFLKASPRHIQIVLLSISLLGLAMLAIFTKEPISFGWVGLSSILIALCYIVVMRRILRAEKTDREEKYELQNGVYKLVKQGKKYDAISSKKAWSGFVLSSVVIIVFSVWISYVGEKIAIATGIKENFVGNIFLAMATSLPELVVSVAAIRLGAIDMALGDLFGSNAFNLMILPITDIFYKKGPLLANVNTFHLGVGFLGIILSIIAVLGIYFRSGKSICRLGWGAATMFSAYLIGSWILFIRG